MVSDIFYIVLLGDTIQMASHASEMNIVYKIYAPKKMTYKLTTSWFKSIDGVSSSRFIFRFHHIKRNGVFNFHYFSPRQDLSSSLLRDRNEDHMQMLRPQEVHIPTYHFEVDKIVGISQSRVIFRVHHSQIYVVVPYQHFSSQRDLSNDLLSNLCGDHMEKFHPRKITYQLTSLGFRKLLMFHILGSCLGYIIAKGMVQSL